MNDGASFIFLVIFAIIMVGVFRSNPEDFFKLDKEDFVRFVNDHHLPVVVEPHWWSFRARSVFDGKMVMTTISTKDDLKNVKSGVYTS